jgi:hypothetical protein
VKRARLIGGAAAAVGSAAILAAGYVVAGLSGLIDAAGLAAVGVLVVIRGTVRGEKPVPVRREDLRRNRRNGDQTAGFPAYRKIASDLEWAQLSRRHYEYAARPMLARLAASLGRPQAVVGELDGLPGSNGPPAGHGVDADGPGVDLATLDRIVTRLEGGSAP